MQFDSSGMLLGQARPSRWGLGFLQGVQPLWVEAEDIHAVRTFNPENMVVNNAVWVGSSDVEVADKIVAYHLGSGALCVKLWHVTVHLDTTGPGQFGETDFMEREQSGMEESPRPASVKWNYKLDDNESIGDFD